MIIFIERNRAHLWRQARILKCRSLIRLVGFRMVAALSWCDERQLRQEQHSHSLAVRNVHYLLRRRGDDGVAYRHFYSFRMILRVRHPVAKTALL